MSPRRDPVALILQSRVVHSVVLASSKDIVEGAGQCRRSVSCSRCT